MTDRIIDPNGAVDYILKHGRQFAQAKANRVYLEIPGWPEYEINQDGEVRRLKASCGTRPMKKLKWTVLNNGYAKVSLCRNQKRHEYLVHRLVAMTFIGDPTGFDVCHFDGDRLNNSVENLRIDTRKGNMADAIRHGTTVRGERCGSNKYGTAQIKSIKDALSQGVRPRAVAEEHEIPLSTIYNIKNGATWGWL